MTPITHLTHNRVRNIRAEFKSLLQNKAYVVSSSSNPNPAGARTIEIANASFIADEDTIFGVVNLDYAERELDWYRSMSLNVNDIPGGPPKIWSAVADKYGFINSNYGWCVFSEDNHCQYKNVRRELMTNPESRRAICIYTRPTMWMDYNKDGRADFMCTNTVQYMIRDNKLITMVNMRSNDAVFGYKNDYHWQKYMTRELWTDLEPKYPELEVGPIYWTAGSLHVYERHFGLVEDSA